MIKKIYYSILSAFILFILLVNTTCFITNGFQPKEMIEIKHLKERGFSFFLFYKHIFTESGIIIKKTTKEKLISEAIKSCDNTIIDCRLVLAIANSSSLYTIYSNGSAGLMRLSPSYTSYSFKHDLFSVHDSVNKASDILSQEYKQNGGDMRETLLAYLKSGKKLTKTEEKDILLLTDKIMSDYIQLQYIY